MALTFHCICCIKTQGRKEIFHTYIGKICCRWWEQHQVLAHVVRPDLCSATSHPWLSALVIFGTWPIILAHVYLTACQRFIVYFFKTSTSVLIMLIKFDITCWAKADFNWRKVFLISSPFHTQLIFSILMYDK